MVTVPTPIHVSQPSGPKTVILPAECRVYLNVPATHHTPRYWPDPYKLDPMRWLKSQSENPSSSNNNNNKKTIAADRARQMKGTFLTFSDGGRVCLGRKFAQSEYIAFLAMLLREYRVELREDMDRSMVEREIYLRCKGTLTLAPLGNVRLVLKRREKVSGRD
jgi:cytochrome P450